MLSHLPKSEAAYEALYRGKLVTIKVSGSELVAEKLGDVVGSINKLTEKDIRVLLLYGGKPQINHHWNIKHDEPRSMENGVGVTTDHVLNDAVIPAYRELRQKLAQVFPNANFIEPEQVICLPQPKPDLGHVGTPFWINGLEEAANNKLTIAGFLSSNPENRNINTDDILACVNQQMEGLIEEVVFVTPTGGVLNTRHEIVSLLLDSRIPNILDGQDEDIQVDGGMHKKLRNTGDMLRTAKKIAMTSAKRIAEELRNWKGAGTLCVYDDALELEPIKNIEHEILKEVILQYCINSTVWRKRTDEEWEQVLKNFYMLRVKSSPLGGFSLLPNGKGWMEFGTLWSAYTRNGIGRFLFDGAKQRAESEGAKIFSCTSEELVRLYKNHGFTHHGLVKDAQNSCLDLCPAIPTLDKYDTSARPKSHFFTWEG